MPRPFAFRLTTAAILAVALVSCSDDETGPEETHTPDHARVFVNDVDMSENLILPAGEAVRVEIRFYTDEDEQITGIEDEHFASITFVPDDFATVEDVTDEHFQKDVTGGGSAGIATFLVGYGHDESADELEFGPYDATVVLTGVRAAAGAQGR
ncbi:MAG TPA: hypothetical protein VEB59_04415 [Gemmatimonadales bacterium]|nr:hypothetical protein [Gemmatimonadales bacterium]